MSESSRGGTAAFVGREHPLSVLRRAVDDALGGAGSFLLLSGEAGIGKTRLMEEAADLAAAGGLGVRYARGWDGGGVPAYWLWSQLIRAHAAERTPDQLRAELGRGAAEVVHLVPELAQLLPDRSAADSAFEGDQARFRIFDAIASFLAAAASTQPLFLGLDDLQWSDAGSIQLLEFIAGSVRRAPLVVCGALRELEVEAASELGRSLDQLQRDATVVGLGGLERREVQMLLTSELGPHQAERLAPDVHRRSGGNPLFVTELGRLVRARDHPGLGLVASVPDTIRSVIDRRLSRIPDDSLGLLRVAATIGEEFGIDLLDRVSGRPRAEVLDLLDDPVRARLVHAIGGTAGFRFAHAAVRDVLYAQLSLGARADAHRRVADALEAAAPDDPPLAEIAAHLQHAALGAADDRAAGYAERAAQRSLAQLAYEDAAAKFAQSLQLIGAGDGVALRRAQLLVALGEARLRTRDVAAARQAFEEAAAIARRRGRGDLLAQAALGFASGLDGFEVRLFDQSQISLLEEALDVLTADDTVLRAWTLARLSVAVTFGESESRRQDLAEEAVKLARQAADPRALAYALGAHCDAIAGPEHSERRLVQAGEMIELARAARDTGMELLGRRLRLVALLELGDVAGVDAEIDLYAATAETLRQPLYLWYVPMWRAMRAMMQGRITDARTLIDEVSRLGTLAQSDNAALLADVLRWNLLRSEGRLRDAGEAMRQQLKLADGIYGEPFWIGLIAPTEFPMEAKTALSRLTPDDFALLPRDAVFLAGMTGVVDACAVVRDLEAAATAYRLLEPFGDRFANDGTATACYGSVSRHLGILAAALEQFDVASRHFEVALAANRRAGALALVADTLSAYGSTLLEAGDRARGEAMLAEAVATYRELGIDLVADRTAQQLDADATDSTSRQVNEFRREGELWTLTYAGRTIHVRHSKGLGDIAALLSQPGREIHVVDLIAAYAGSPPAGTRPDSGDLGSSDHASTGDPILDDPARMAYRERLLELRDELDEAEAFTDSARAARARAEMDMLSEQLASALGLGGRARTTGNPSERARKAVAQRVRNVIRRIEAEHPDLARHLHASLHMGTFCSYSPEHSTMWLA